MKLNYVDGRYSPSFFNMTLMTDERVETAIERHSETFIHEFIHYLQDLILPYNIRLNMGLMRQFLNVRRCALEGIERPFDRWGEDERLLRLQFDYTIGKNKREEDYVLHVRKMEDAVAVYEEAGGYDEIFTGRERNFKIFTYNIKVNDMQTSYNLGARDLLEYIACKIGKRHYPCAKELPQLPYMSVDLLFEHYGLSSVPEDVRVCVAEACLYNDNPMRLLLFQFLEKEEMKQMLCRLSYDEIYRFLLSMEFRTTDGVAEAVRHKTYRKLKQFETDLNVGYFYFEGIRNWITEVSDFAKSELTDRFIFSDMYRMSDEEFSRTVSAVISRIGFPLVMNRKRECVTILSGGQGSASGFVQFYVMQEFMRYITGTGEERCPVYEFCRANWGSDSDGCDSGVKLKRIDNKDCPYAEFLNAYGLENRV